LRFGRHQTLTEELIPSILLAFYLFQVGFLGDYGVLNFLGGRCWSTSLSRVFLPVIATLSIDVCLVLFIFILANGSSSVFIIGDFFRFLVVT
jgi:hypothetical protein